MEAIGYDLSFLASRTSYILTPINAQQKVQQSDYFECTKGFQELPNVYVQDLQILFLQQLSASDLREIENSKLNSYLKIFQIPQKVEMGISFA